MYDVEAVCDIAYQFDVSATSTFVCYTGIEGNQIAIDGYRDTTSASIFDADSFTHLYDIEHAAELTMMASISASGPLLISTWDQQTLLYEPHRGAVIQRYDHADDLYSFVYSPRGKYLAASSMGHVRICDTQTGDELQDAAVTCPRRTLS